jgi:hypothetical protein
MNRRRFLSRAGAVTILVVGGGVWYANEEGAFSQGKGPAFEPWMDWDQPETGILALVRAGILSASPHNSQPWLFRVKDNEIVVLADTRRNTGELDPFLRELHISIGNAGESSLIQLSSGSIKMPSFSKTSKQLSLN